MTRLTRSMIDRTFGGVCGGLSTYLGVNAWWVRVAFVTVALFTFGTGILIYLALWLAMPEQRLSELDQITFRPNRIRPEALVLIGFGVIIAGMLVLALNLGVLDNTNGGALLPFGVILLGLTLFAQQLRRV